MAQRSARTASCSRTQASERLGQARTYLDAAELVAGDGEFTGVAAALAVLSGVASSDAACCAVLGKHHRGSDHRGAVGLLRTVSPGGQQMARDLQRLLDRKEDAHYGFGRVGGSSEQRMLEWAQRLHHLARTAFEA